MLPTMGTGDAWALICSDLPERTVNAVQSRLKSLKRKRGHEWTQEEDQAIIDGKNNRKKWKTIVKMLPESKRTKNAVITRWKDLLKADPSQNNLVQSDIA